MISKPRKILYAAVIALLLCSGPRVLCAEDSDSVPLSKEYRIKAAYLYNFLKIIGWPEALPETMQKHVTLATIGDNPFHNSLKELENKMIQGKPISVKHFGSFAKLQAELETQTDSEEVNQQLEEIGCCHLLFVSQSEAAHLRAILRLTEKRPVLTVGETPKFLETGGILNFVSDGKKGGFEIDLGHAKELGMTVSSKLLRLAERVVEKDNNGRAN